MSGKYYKSPQFGVVFCNESWPTPISRICWPSLVTPKPGMKQKDGTVGEAKYEATILIPKDAPGLKKFLSVLTPEVTAMLELYNEGLKAKLNLSPEDYFKDGDDFDLEKYPYYKNCYVIQARNRKPVNVVSASKDEITADAIKGGMQVVAMVAPLITAKGLSFKLEVVQLVKDDGVRFGGGGKDLQKLKDALPTFSDEGEEAQAQEVAQEIEPEPVKAKTAAPAQKGMKAALARL